MDGVSRDNQVWMLDRNPVLAARYLPDYLLNMQPINVYHLLSQAAVAAECESATWLLHHGIACCAEYNYRFNKTHNAFRVLSDIAAAYSDNLTLKFPTHRSVQYERENCLFHLMHLPLDHKWTHRQLPEFFKTTRKDIQKT